MGELVVIGAPCSVNVGGRRKRAAMSLYNMRARSRTPEQAADAAPWARIAAASAKRRMKPWSAGDVADQT